MQKMDYFAVSGDIEQMGNIYPVTDGMRKGYDEINPNSFRNLKFATMPDFIPNLQGIVVKPKAKLTDFISTRTPNPLYGLLISPRLNEALGKYSDGTHASFQAEVDYNGKSYPYFWLHLCFDAKPYIDFQNSLFTIKTIGTLGTERINLNSLAAYENAVRTFSKTTDIRADRIGIKGEVDEIPHLFGIGIGGRYTVASKTLVDDIKRQGFSGLLFSQADWLEVLAR